MDIRVIYDPSLRQVAKPVTVFDAELKKQADEMTKLMQTHYGIGLAANQVGLDKRLLVVGYHKSGPKDETPEIPFQQLCNPEVIKFSKEKDIMDEGCLSLPGLELPVERPSGVVIEAYTIEGKKVEIKAKGLYARVLQHEIDHLNGILFTDHVKNYRDIRAYQFAKIVFCGSDNFSLVHLQALVESGLTVMAVITETDKQAGRGQQLTSTPVKEYAKKEGIAVFQPEDTDELTFILKQLQPDLLVLASYGKILPPEALAVAAYGNINVHPSLLPKYRGATPIQTAILNGDAQTGITIMEMSPRVDAGGIISQVTHPISPVATTAGLTSELAQLGAQTLIKTLPVFLSGQAHINTQNAEEVIGTKKLTKEMGEIDWSRSASEIDRQIRALNPWPGTYTFLEGKRLKILGSQLVDNKLRLLTVQLEGKIPAGWDDFKRGYANQLTKTPWFSTIQ